MKAILLAGGKGTRLRPLTIHTPKPIVPIFNRPFLHYQIDLLKQVPEIDEVILSLNYQPRRIEEIFGDGSDVGIKIRYVVEPAPLGTAGAVKYAGDKLTESVVVFNGDVLTQIDLAAVIRLHRERQATATIVLTPVENPTAYGLVETDARRQHHALSRKAEARRDHDQQHQRRHLRPRAGHLRPDPERRGLVDRAELLPVAGRARRDLRRLRLQRLLDRHRHAGEVHAGAPRHHGRPLRRGAVPRPVRRRGRRSPPDARIEDGATVEGPCFIDEGVLGQGGARIGPYSVIGRQTQIEEDAVVDGAIIWPNCRISRDADRPQRDRRPQLPRRAQRHASTTARCSATRPR